MLKIPVPCARKNIPAALSLEDENDVSRLPYILHLSNGASPSPILATVPQLYSMTQKTDIGRVIPNHLAVRSSEIPFRAR